MLAFGNWTLSFKTFVLQCKLKVFSPNKNLFIDATILNCLDCTHKKLARLQHFFSDKSCMQSSVSLFLVQVQRQHALSSSFKNTKPDPECFRNSLQFIQFSRHLHLKDFKPSIYQTPCNSVILWCFLLNITTSIILVNTKHAQLYLICIKK